MAFPVEMNGNADTLWVTEVETILGLPIHYTDAQNMSITKRQHLLGEAWSVHVVKHVLQPLRLFFECEGTVGKKKQRKWTPTQSSSLPFKNVGNKTNYVIRLVRRTGGCEYSKTQMFSITLDQQNSWISKSVVTKHLLKYMIHIPVLELNINGQLQCVTNMVEPSISWAGLGRAQSKGNVRVGRKLQSFLVSKSDTFKPSAIKKACLTKYTRLAQKE